MKKYFTRQHTLIYCCGLFIGTAIYAALYSLQSEDAIFLSIASVISVFIACFQSPHNNVMSGIRMLWHYDLIAALGMPAIVAFTYGPENLSIAAIHYTVFILFSFAAMISVRKVFMPKITPENKSHRDGSGSLPH